MIKQQAAHGDPEAETKARLDRLAEVTRERARYQKMAGPWPSGNCEPSNTVKNGWHT